MKSAEYYRGREQTYLKHFFLERYLERVAYNIGSFASDFVYVDGFSGPWQSEDEAFEDTSFVIALNQLRRVRSGLARVGKKPRIRCLFIEANGGSFERLRAATAGVEDMDVQSLHGEFEELIPDILRFIGRSFSLVFIDPTGWTGFGLRQIAPILQHRPGEILVNFMFDHINRFLEDPREEITSTFDGLFGAPGWNDVVVSGPDREEAIIHLYRERLRATGRFEHVTSTRILKPTSDRSYFYLVYGTRHVKGLMEFRGVEKKAVEEQERVRLGAKQYSRVERTGQSELFSPTGALGPPSFDEARARQLTLAANRLRRLLRNMPRVKYEAALADLLELPLVWESDVKMMIMDMRAAGEIEIVGLGPRERTPKPGHVLQSHK